MRRHQRVIDRLMQAIAADETPVRDVLAAVTPGGGKSLLPVIAARHLLGAGVVERVIWVVPRDSLRQQAEEAFADPAWRQALGHALAVRAADNGPDPSRGLAGYVTTYQAITAAPALHWAECQRYRTLLVIDELHHLPALDEAGRGDGDDEAAWSRALWPLFETATVRLLLSGTLQRADGRAILWLPYRRPGPGGTRDLDLEVPGWAVVGYSRRTALEERAILPCVFGAVDGEAEWLDADREPLWPAPTQRPSRSGSTGAVYRPADRVCRAVARSGAASLPRPAPAAAAGAGPGAASGGVGPG